MEVTAAADVGSFRGFFLTVLSDPRELPPPVPAHIYWEVKPGFPRFHCRCLLNALSHPLIWNHSSFPLLPANHYAL